MLVALASACGASTGATASSSEEAARSPRTDDTGGVPLGASPVDFALVAPERFDLGVPDDFFDVHGRRVARRHRRDPARRAGAATCAVKGLAIAGDFLALSCVVQAGDDSHPGATAAHVLTAPLGDVLAGAAEWKVADLADRLPPRVRARIAGAHPSGMIHDPERGGVWVGHAVSAPGPRTRLLLFDPARVGAPATGSRSTAPVARTFELSGYRASAVALVDHRYLLAAGAPGEAFVTYDLAGPGQASIIGNSLFGSDDEVAYSDCKTWRESIVVCAGVHTARDSRESTRSSAGHRGRLQALRVDATAFPDVRIDLLGYLAIEADGEGEGGASDGPGAPGQVLAAGAMEIDREHGYAYFVSGALPRAELVRLRFRAQ